MQYYKVGGAVRDRLLNRPVKDIDWVVVGATAKQLLEQGFQPVGQHFPVFLHPKTKQEYALARTERKVAAGYAGFNFYAEPDVTLEQDLARRDLTINAIAEDEHGQLIDPFNGQADLQAGILRHVSDAFVEDPVRILRIARFATRFDFKVAPETLHLMREMVGNGEVDALVAERVWQETERALGEAMPWRFVTVLRDCGALAKIFPEIDRLFGVPQVETYHPEIDTGLHTLMCLQQAKKLNADPQIMFAVLTHDLGKGTTKEETLPHHYGHEQRSADLIDELCDRYRVPNAYRQLAIMLARYHTHCHRFNELNSKTVLNALHALDALRRPQRFEQFLVGCEADARGRKGFEDCDYPQADQFRQALKAIQGVDVKALVEAGYRGEEMKDALRKRQLWALKQMQVS